MTAVKKNPEDFKTERLHMLISPSERDEIDEWRFQNRVGTRAEAVRRLIALGLESGRYRTSSELIEHVALAAWQARMETTDGISSQFYRDLTRE